MKKLNTNFFTTGNKRNPVNLYYSLHPFLTSHNNSRNFSGRTNTDSNFSNNLIKSKKWNLSDMIDIKKKLNLAVKKRMTFIKNKQINKKISTFSQIHMNSINEGILNSKINLNNTGINKKINLNNTGLNSKINSNNKGINKKINLNDTNTIRNNKTLVSYNNSKIKSNNNSHNYINKGNIVKKKINFNLSNNSFKTYKNNKSNKSNKINKINPIKKKINKNKIKNNIPFNINKININIINNNNININTIKTEGNTNNNNNNNHTKKLLKRRKNFTLEKLPQFDKLLKKKINNNNNIKEKDKLIPYKIIVNKINNISKKRNINNNHNSTNTNINSSTNYSLSNRINNIISNNEDISLLSKNFIRNIKRNISKNKYIINDKSLEHKKIIPINYFQDYKKKNSSQNKNIKKGFINNTNYIKIKNNKKKIKIKNNIYNSKSRRPYSKEDKDKTSKSNIILKLKEKSKEKNIKSKILKIVAKKNSLPEQILVKKINKNKNNNLINILSKSEIKKRRAKSNNKSHNIDESQKIYEEENTKIYEKIKENNNNIDNDNEIICDNKDECNIDDILKNKKIKEGEIDDNFDDLYSIVKLINFDDVKDKEDNVFSLDENRNYLIYKIKFEKIWNKFKRLKINKNYIC